MKTLSTLVAGFLFLSAPLLLGGCGHGGAGASSDAAPAPKPMTPESTAAATKRFSKDLTPDEPRAPK